MWSMMWTLKPNLNVLSLYIHIHIYIDSFCCWLPVFNHMYVCMYVCMFVCVLVRVVSNCGSIVKRNKNTGINLSCVCVCVCVCARSCVVCLCMFWKSVKYHKAKVSSKLLLVHSHYALWWYLQLSSDAVDSNTLWFVIFNQNYLFKISAIIFGDKEKSSQKK